MINFLLECYVRIEGRVMDNMMFGNDERNSRFVSKSIPCISMNDIKFRILFLDFYKKREKLVQRRLKVQITMISLAFESPAEVLRPDIYTGIPPHLSDRDLHVIFPGENW
jgi:hypothetical protein